LVGGLTSTIEEILSEITSLGKENSFPTWYESDEGLDFQEGMSLNRWFWSIMEAWVWWSTKMTN